MMSGSSSLCHVNLANNMFDDKAAPHLAQAIQVSDMPSEVTLGCGLL